MEKQTFVVALLSYLKPVGHVILPYSCSIENDKFITIYERITELNVAQYPDLSQGEKELVKLSESYSNTALIKQFSKNKKLLPKDFFATLELKGELQLRGFLEESGEGEAGNAWHIHFWRFCRKGKLYSVLFIEPSPQRP